MELIDKDKLIQHLKNYYDDSVKEGYTVEAQVFDDIITEIQVLPTIDCIKSGHVVWKERITGGYKYITVKCHNCKMEESVEIERPLQDKIPYCSECGKRLCSRSMHYCPSCGSKME